MIAEAKLRAYPALNRMFWEAVEQAFKADLAVSRKMASGKRAVTEWPLQKVKEAGFTSILEARAAVKALKGKLKDDGSIIAYSDGFPVFVRMGQKLQAEKTAFIHFLVFLSKVKRGNPFQSIDRSQSVLLLFHRARVERLIVERITESNASTWVVFKDPMELLQEKVDRLPLALRMAL